VLLHGAAPLKAGGHPYLTIGKHLMAGVRSRFINRINKKPARWRSKGGGKLSALHGAGNLRREGG
jgi:hypothetical protein